VYSGKADLCEELPKDGMECQEDLYGRPIKEFWLRLTTRPFSAGKRPCGVKN